jgi:ribosomal protein S21
LKRSSEENSVEQQTRSRRYYDSTKGAASDAGQQQYKHRSACQSVARCVAFKPSGPPHSQTDA